MLPDLQSDAGTELPNGIVAARESVPAVAGGHRAEFCGSSEFVQFVFISGTPLRNKLV
jgi:hypothetical protein